MTDPTPEIAELISAFEDCWSRVKPTELKALWDPTEPEPYYIAEEVTDPMIGWQSIEPYWQAAEDMLLRFSIRTWDLKCKFMAESLATANFMMHWNGVVKGMESTPIGLDVRVSALTRMTANGWRFCHYVESPLGALPYIKSTYTRNVDPAFLQG